VQGGATSSFSSSSSVLMKTCTVSMIFVWKKINSELPLQSSESTDVSWYYSIKWIFTSHLVIVQKVKVLQKFGLQQIIKDAQVWDFWLLGFSWVSHHKAFLGWRLWG
jgi:hypothetical protein